MDIINAVQCAVDESINEGIQFIVSDNLNENVPEEKIIKKLQSGFGLSEKKAIEYVTKGKNQLVIS